MSVKSIHIDEASDEQLRAFVTNFLNLDLGDGDPRAAISRAQPGVETIFYLEDEALILTAEDDKPEASGGTVGSLGRGDPKWEINIPIVDTEDNSGKNDVVVGVNGRAWQIMRGCNVVVPHRVVVALDNAITDVVRHTDEGDVDVRKAKRFAYATVAQPSAEEIEAWDKLTADQFCA